MGLWEPGEVEGVTLEILEKVCKQARRDHTPSAEFINDYREDALPVSAGKMRIHELRLPPAGDLTYDRCAHARSSIGEVFEYGGTPGWRVEADAGSWWRIRRGPFGLTAQVGTEELAALLTAQNGPHPNPYIAYVEVGYNKEQARAGYGIRQDGTPVLWYN